jgi:hypothetical protein
MVCSLCRQRPSRRACPAIDQRICTVCCGRKRLVEIACRPDCGYLAASHAHPAASVRKQQERDIAFIMAIREGLTERQSELLWAILTFLGGVRADPLARLNDEDMMEACGALAATLETAGRGLIYEHRPQSLVAQRLVTDLKAFLAGLTEKADSAAARTLDKDATIVLRHIQATAQVAPQRLSRDGPVSPAAAMEMIGRVTTGLARREAGQSEGLALDDPGSLLVKP